MGKQFRWDTDADFAAAERPLPIPPKRLFSLITSWLVGTAVILFSLLAGWLLLNNRATQTEAHLQASFRPFSTRSTGRTGAALATSFLRP